ncbi:phage tail tube protein [Collinsella aerofaciens]|uniref:phage tail tube protein n=1 Tax=Collinsella aerofaciens TaxID=74426 RepID=UPI00359C7581
MAETNTNNQANVSSAKGVKGGYIFSAPEGTSLPTDINTPLDPAFKCLGFISEDGYVETVDEDADDITDMNGDVMDSTNSNRVESAQLTLAELKAETLKRQYGSDNVKDENGIITVKHNADSHDVFAYVLELVLKKGRRWRKVVPKGKSSELDDLTIASSELCQRALTMKYLTDEQGNTCYDYYESTETTKAA